MRSIDGNQAVVNGTNNGPFRLPYGGLYDVSVIGTNISGSNTVELQKLGPDGSTYVSLYAPFNNAGTEADLIIGKFGANGMKTFYLGAGTYKFVVTSATAVYASVIRIAGE